VRFERAFLTTTHLGIAMEFAAGGELFERIVRAGRFPEDEARYFFQQLICGVGWCVRSRSELLRVVQSSASSVDRSKQKMPNLKTTNSPPTHPPNQLPLPAPN
jgi:hypothetical protein